MISDTTKTILVDLGGRIRDARIVKGDKQVSFAVRLGVTVPTLRKLENGDPTVSLGTFAEALFMLDKIEDLDQLLVSTSLFEKWEASQRKKRKRAFARRSGKKE